MRNNKQTVIPTDTYMVQLINSLLANCEGHRDRIPEMESEIQPSDLPEDLPLQRQILDVLGMCSRRTIPPTFTNITNGIRVAYKPNPGFEEQVLEIIGDSDRGIRGNKTENEDVIGLSTWLWEDVKIRRAKHAWQKSDDVLSHGTGNVSERIAEAVEIVTGVMDTSSETSVYINQATAVAMSRELMRRRTAERKKGRVPGASLVFDGFIDTKDQPGKVPYLRYGRTTLITCATGNGKTLAGQVIAEHNAWKYGLNVLYLHLETEPDTMLDRSASRWTLIPADMLGAGVVDIDDPNSELAKKYNQYLDWVASPKKQWETNGPYFDSGELIYTYCPGWDVFKVNNAIRAARKLSDAQGRGLLVIVDYYNLIDRQAFQAKGIRETSAMGLVAYHLRECIKRENRLSQMDGGVGVHAIVFAQESGDGDGAYAYGSKEIVQYSQLHISFQRTKATDNLEVKGGKDALGKQRFWQKTGGNARDAQFVINKGNDNQKGVVHVHVDNFFYNIYSCPQNVVSVSLADPPKK